MSIDLDHRCTDIECPMLGQRSSTSCRCHRTREQVAASLIDADRHVFEWFNERYPDEMAECLAAMGGASEVQA